MTYREALEAAKRASHETNGQRIVCVVLDEQDEDYDIVWDEIWAEEGYTLRPIIRVWVLYGQVILLTTPAESY